jgi:hypothetical protein
MPSQPSFAGVCKNDLAVALVMLIEDDAPSSGPGHLGAGGLGIGPGPLARLSIASGWPAESATTRRPLRSFVRLADLSSDRDLSHGL